MTEIAEKKGSVAGRSPAYPFVALDKALGRAEALRKAVGNKGETRVVSAMHHWGYGPKSSGGIQTVAALKHFGLLEDFGSGKDRRVKLTELALRILLDSRPNSGERAELIKRAALMPKMHQELWERWGAELPVDAELRHYLLLDRGFNENGADDLIAEYKSTISYAKLSDSDTVSPDQTDISPMQEPTPKQTKITDPAIAAMAEMFKPRQQPPRVQPENAIKVMMDGNRLQVSANVDAKGAQKLLKAITAYLDLLGDNDEEAAN